MARKPDNDDAGLPEPKGMRARLDRREREKEQIADALDPASRGDLDKALKKVESDAHRADQNRANPGMIWAFSKVFGWLFSPFRAAALSGLLIGLSFQPHDVPGLIFVALVPLFLALPRFKTRLGAFLGSYTCGVIAFAMVLRYLAEMEAANGDVWMIRLSWLVSSAIPALSFGFMGLTARFFQRRMPRAWWLVLIPVIWTGFEFWRFYAPAPFPPMLAGYALPTIEELEVFIQIADLGSVLLVSLFVALINGAFTVSIDAGIKLERSGTRLAWMLVLLAFGSNFAYGFMRLEQVREEYGLREDGPVVAIIQPNLTQAEKHLGDPDSRWRRHVEMIEEAVPGQDARAIAGNASEQSGEGETPGSAGEQEGEEAQSPPLRPELIILSETAVPNGRGGPFPSSLADSPISPWPAMEQSLTYTPKLEETIVVDGRRLIAPTFDPRRIAKDKGIPMIFGAHAKLSQEEWKEHYPYLDKEWFNKVTFNRAYYVDAEGTVQGLHDKARLVPFGEYIPYGDTEIGQQVADKAKEYLGYEPKILPGYRRETFRLKDNEGREFRFSMNICYEYFFPDIYQELHRKQNVHFAVTLSNEAWYFDSTELDQAMVMSKFRAIENRTTFVRATNSGISAIIAPDGSETRFTAVNDKGRRSDRLVKGVMKQPIPYLEKPPQTFFLRHGMLLGWGTGLAALGLMVLAFGFTLVMWPLRRIFGWEKRESEQRRPKLSRAEEVAMQERARQKQLALQRRKQEAAARLQASQAQAKEPAPQTGKDTPADKSEANPKPDAASPDKGPAADGGEGGQA